MVSHLQLARVRTARSSGEQKYNFEVSIHHNYVANGYRVHNHSFLDLLPQGALQLSSRYSAAEQQGTVEYVLPNSTEVHTLYWEDLDADGDADFGIHHLPDGTFVYQSGEDGAQSLASANWSMISRMAGSFLGQVLSGDGLEGQIQAVTLNFARSFAGALGQPVAGAWAEYRDITAGEDTLLVAHRSNAEAWSELGRDVSHLGQSAAVGALSSYLVAELLESLGVEGFAAELGQSIGSAVLGQALSNVTGIGDGIDGIFNTIGDG